MVKHVYETHLNKEFTNKGTKFFLSYADAHQYVSEAFANLDGQVTCFKEWNALGSDNFMGYLTTKKGQAFPHAFIMQHDLN